MRKKYQKIKWGDFIKKIKIGDILMVNGNDGTVQELRFDGFKEKNGKIEITFQPLALEFIEKTKSKRRNK